MPTLNSRLGSAAAMTGAPGVVQECRLAAPTGKLMRKAEIDLHIAGEWPQLGHTTSELPLAA
jgi:hypothetical protein